MTFHTLVGSKLDNVAPAWQPWLSNTNHFCVDRLQNSSLGLITSQLVSTPLEALRLEANVQSYPKLANKAAKEGTTIGTGTILRIFLSTSIQVNNDTICEVLPTHELVASVYQHRRVSRDAQQINSR